jgi:hypothetical protein
MRAAENLGRFSQEIGGEAAHSARVRRYRQRCDDNYARDRKAGRRHELQHTGPGRRRRRSSDEPDQDAKTDARGGHDDDGRNSGWKESEQFGRHAEGRYRNAGGARDGEATVLPRQLSSWRT